MSTEDKQRVAVILAGAVAKGAYEAGVLRGLADANVQVTRIVAASAGALNGAYFAYAVRAGREREGADELIDLWRGHASLCDVFSLDVPALLRRVGVSKQTKLRDLLRTRIVPGPVAQPRPISLRMVVSSLDGIDPTQQRSRGR